jgi:hypothetical protein
MRFVIKPTRRSQAGFTLAELLASLLFLALVIPAAVQALRVSSLAGSVSARKGAAARIADRVLNESLILTNWTGTRSGTITEGTTEFHWTLQQANWTGQNIQAIQELTAEVVFSAQGRDFSVKLATLVDTAVLNPTSTLSTTPATPSTASR